LQQISRERQDKNFETIVCKHLARIEKLAFCFNQKLKVLKTVSLTYISKKVFRWRDTVAAQQ
jgi:hypothetical protein